MKKSKQRNKRKNELYTLTTLKLQQGVAKAYVCFTGHSKTDSQSVSLSVSFSVSQSH